MHRIDGPGNVANQFTEGDPGNGTPATTVTADILNALQEEISGVVEGAGLVLDKPNNAQFLEAVNLIIGSNTTPIGFEGFWYGDTAPLGYLEQDGALYSMTTYNGLDLHVGGTSALDAGVVCTFDDVAETANVAGHGLANDTILRFTNSGGALPPVITARTARFYVVNATANDYQLSLTKGGAPIDIVGTGTGVHSFHVKFAVPNPRGRTFRIWDRGLGLDADAASRTDRGDGVTGDNNGTKQGWLVGPHTHPSIVISGYSRPDAAGSAERLAAGTSGSNGGTESRMVNEYRMAIIKAY